MFILNFFYITPLRILSFYINTFVVNFHNTEVFYA